MKVYIIRHGESVTNEEGKWTGWLDVELTAKGISDAEKVKPLLKDIAFDKVYASDLKRAVKTAQVALPGYDYETSKLLREIDVGTFAGKPLDYYYSLTPEEQALNLKNAFKDFGGESVDDLDERVQAFLKELETKDYQNVALFTHGGWQRSIFDYIIGYRHKRSNILLSNCAVVSIEFIKGYWRLTGLLNL